MIYDRVRTEAFRRAIDSVVQPDDIVLDALKTTRGNRAKAARLLGTTERIINYKVRKYAIDSERFRT